MFPNGKYITVTVTSALKLYTLLNKCYIYLFDLGAKRLKKNFQNNLASNLKAF